MTFGHTLVVDPWGDIIAEGGESPAVIPADWQTLALGASPNSWPRQDSSRSSRPPASGKASPHG